MINSLVNKDKLLNVPKYELFELRQETLVIKLYYFPINEA